MNSKDGRLKPGNVQISVSSFLVPIALVAVLYVFPLVASGISQFLLACLLLCGLTVIFWISPSAAPYSLLASVPQGGIEIALFGKTPKIYFCIVVAISYLTSVFFRSATQQISSESMGNRLAVGFSWKLLLCCAIGIYLMSIIPSFFLIEDIGRSAYLIINRIIVVSMVLLLLCEQRIAIRMSSLLLIVEIVGSAIAVAYLLQAIREYDAGNILDLAAGLALKDNSVRVGVLGTTNTIASFLAFTIPISLASYRTFSTRGLSKIRIIGSVLIQSLGLLSTASRGGIVALLAGLMFAIAITSNGKVRFIRALGATALLIVILFGSLQILGEAIQERYFSSFQKESLLIYSTNRFELWRSSVSAFASNPVFGIGIGNVGKFDADFGSGDGSEAHNLFLQTLAEEGVLSFGSLVFVLVLIVITAVKAAPSREASRMFLVAGLVSAIINSLIEPTFWHPPFSVLFWVTSIAVYGDSLRRGSVVGVAD
jgi:O-antigen ligase